MARWREVESGARYTMATALARYPQLNKHSFDGMPSEIARKPKSSTSKKACDVKTFSATDVDALVARLAEPEPVDPLWREVESGARYTKATATARYPQLSCHSLDGMPSEIANKPRDGSGYSREVKTYAAAAVDALVARLAEPEAVDPLWREVESGARYTATTAMQRYPQLSMDSVHRLPSRVARKPKSSTAQSRDVKTYSAADVDALAARLAAPVRVGPRWREVESGSRYTAATAMARYPQLTWYSFDALPSLIARKPTSGTHHTCDVKTYSIADVEALAARLAAPEAVDPLWREVESGARYTQTTAMARYRRLNRDHFADLPFEIARKPKTSKQGACDVKTYSAANVEALVAAQAVKPAVAAKPSKKRAVAAQPKRAAAAPPKKRAQQPEPPQEPKEEDECAICFADASRTHACAPCGHKCVCASCASTHLSASGSRCPICRAEVTMVIPIFG